MIASKWMTAYGSDPGARERRIGTLRREGAWGILLAAVGWLELVFIILFSNEHKDLAEACGMSIAVLVMAIGIALKAKVSLEQELLVLLDNMRTGQRA